MKLLSQPLIRPSCRIASHAARSGMIVLEGALHETDGDGWFRDLISRLHQRAVAGQLDEVVLDLRGVEFANAGAWKALVGWFRVLRDETSTYTIRLLCDEDHRWQQVGIPAMRVFGRDHLVLEVYRGARRIA